MPIFLGKALRKELAKDPYLFARLVLGDVCSLIALLLAVAGLVPVWAVVASIAWYSLCILEFRANRHRK